MAHLWRRFQSAILLAVGLSLGLIIGVWIFADQPPEAPEGGRNETQDGAALGPSPYEGSRAPDFMLHDLEGGEIRLSDFEGHVVFLNFWATWCGPCQLEMPDIQGRFLKYKDQGLIVMGVNFDEAPSEVEAFRDRLGLTFTILLDPGALVQRQYQITGYPTSIIVDRQGVIRVRHVGLLGPAQLDRYLQKTGIEL
jgi:cytochrome c biogenesis protein CcmG/thiol:disulfide interchange protein DsbE